MAGTRQSTFQSASHASVTFVGLLLLIEVADLIVRLTYPGYSIKGLGIRPREQLGLIGIVFSPLLHGDVYHLAANAVPLLVLLTLLFWDRRYYPVRTLALIWILSGLGTWAIGRPGTLHIGASSLIYGLVTYLLVVCI